MSKKHVILPRFDFFALVCGDFRKKNSASIELFRQGLNFADKSQRKPKEIAPIGAKFAILHAVCFFIFIGVLLWYVVHW